MTNKTTFISLLLVLWSAAHSSIEISTNCGAYATCTECASQLNCAWCSSTLECVYNDGIGSNLNNEAKESDDGDVICIFGDEWLMNEELMCEENNHITIVSLDKDKEMRYNTLSIVCNGRFSGNITDINELKQDNLFESWKNGELENLENEMENDDDATQFGNVNISCVATEAETKFWIIESNDNSMSYHLFGKLMEISQSTKNYDIFDDDFDTMTVINEEITQLWPPCDIYIDYGVLSNITCGNVTDGNIEEDYQSNMLLLTLKQLLPRTNEQFYQENHSIAEENSIGIVVSNRSYVNSYENGTKTLTRVKSCENVSCFFLAGCVFARFFSENVALLSKRWENVFVLILNKTAVSNGKL